MNDSKSAQAFYALGVDSGNVIYIPVTPQETHTPMYVSKKVYLGDDSNTLLIKGVMQRFLDHEIIGIFASDNFITKIRIVTDTYAIGLLGDQMSVFPWYVDSGIDADGTPYAVLVFEIPNAG